jgi:Sulfotransferase domain
MSLTVIGAGVGRTGTYSLKLALEKLGYGPCHHMEDVIKDPPVHVPLWMSAAQGKPDWAKNYSGFKSAVDWPTASFWNELAHQNPNAKFVLTVRSAKSWAQSFSETIQKLIAGLDQAPPHMRPFIEMGIAVLGKAGFTPTQDHDALVKAFDAHNNAVIAGLPKNRLLVYEVKNGWAPLCKFLDKPFITEQFPKTNNREDFWERIKGGG